MNIQDTYTYICANKCSIIDNEQFLMKRKKKYQNYMESLTVTRNIHIYSRMIVFLVRACCSL